MRGSKILSWVVLGALVLGVLAMLGLVMYQQGVSETESDAQQVEITALQAGLKEANARLEARGDAPVPVPEVDDDGAASVVPIAPTQAQILSAFDVWCDLRSCHGSDGEDGEDAPPMTRQQVLDGFTTWCGTSNLCAGANGTNGADGADGAPGRPPTAEEVLAAVEVVCGPDRELCTGPAGTDGKDGKDGANGAPGRGIAKTECHTTGDWIITYTDGTAGTTSGPCRVMQPTPTPTPTPSASTTKGR